MILSSLSVSSQLLLISEVKSLLRMYIFINGMIFAVLRDLFLDLVAVRGVFHADSPALERASSCVFLEFDCLSLSRLPSATRFFPPTICLHLFD